MTGKLIQEAFGNKMIEAIADFARADLKPPDQLEQNEFAHIKDPALRKTLARVLYGTRWIYKLGLALLTRNEERAAHIRAQILDYGSVCEGLLSEALAHALRSGHKVGSAYLWDDPDAKQKPIKWNLAAPEPTISRRSFWWVIRIAREFHIVAPALEKDLNWLRDQRNDIHLRKLASVGAAAFLKDSSRAFYITNQTIQATKSWRASHP